MHLSKKPSIRFCLASALLLVSACTNQTTNVDPTDTNTNWLTECEADDECEGRFSCLCGVCTLSCEEQSSCDDISSKAVCSPAESQCASATRICLKTSSSAGMAGNSQPDSGVNTGDVDASELRAAGGGAPSDIDGGLSQSTASSGAGGSSASQGGASSIDADSGASQSGGMASGSDSGAASTAGDAGGISSVNGGAQGGAPAAPNGNICALPSLVRDSGAAEMCSGDDVCCTCGCGAPGASCLNEQACPPLIGVACGVDYCSAPGDVCCDAEIGLCAPDASFCAIAASVAPTSQCVTPSLERYSELNGRFAGELNMLQRIGGEEKTTMVEVQFELGDYNLPYGSLAALGYVGDGWEVYASPVQGDLSLLPLYAQDGVGTVWAYNENEADGSANELTFTNSCFELSRSKLTWSYEVTYAVTDLVDYESYGYEGEGVPIVDMTAVESYELLADGTVIVTTTADGLDGDQEIHFELSGIVEREASQLAD